MDNIHHDWEDERAALSEALSIIEENIEFYTEQKGEYDATVKALYDAYHSDNPELISDLYLNMDLQDLTNRTLKNNYEAAKKPYFGSIGFADESDGEHKHLRIGKRGVSKQSGEQHIFDWRAPVSTLYYENSLSHTTYKAPEGEMPVTLTSKRTYEIEKGELIDYYDSEVVTNDELLQKYLAHNKDVVLGEIIATIQKDQNEIIRTEAWRNVVVQGSAGSGKTTVAMHRIAYLLYNYPQNFRSADFYIIGGNRMFLNYITGSLPDLDVTNVNQMTMPDLMLYCLDVNKATVLPVDGGSADAIYVQSIELKSSLEFARLCDRYMDTMMLSLFASADIADAGRVFLSKKELSDFSTAHAGKDFYELADMLNDRLAYKLEYRENAMFDELSPKAFKKYFQKRLAGLRADGVYRDFVAWLAENVIRDPSGRQALALIEAGLRRKRYDVYDLTMLLYIKQRLGLVEGLGRIKHVIVDEAQDFGEIVIYVLTRALKNARFTVIGDVTQNISGSTGLYEWESLMGAAFGSYDKFTTLSKSYRNTIEISYYAARALRQLPAGRYPVEPIVRHGLPVGEHVYADGRAAHKALPPLLEDIKSRGYGMIALICRTERECAKLHASLAHLPDVHLASPDMESFEKGVTLFPAPLVKGLEFDAVVIWDADPSRYTETPFDARLLYVSLTRALHELHVCAVGGLTELVKD